MDTSKVDVGRETPNSSDLALVYRNDKGKLKIRQTGDATIGKGVVLLDPMAAVQTDLFRIRYELLQVVGLRNRVPVSIDHECWLLDDRVGGRQQVPVPVQVSVPIDAARETR